MVCFNLTESESDESGQRREDDETKLKYIIDNDMTLQDKNIDVENLVRLGKRKNDDNPNAKQSNRPLRFRVKSFDDKRQILQRNTALKNHLDETKRKIYVTPDLTKKQRDDSFKLEKSSDIDL